MLIYPPHLAKLIQAIQNELNRDRTGTRTRVHRIMRLTPYPLGHEADAFLRFQIYRVSFSIATNPDAAGRHVGWRNDNIVFLNADLPPRTFYSLITPKSGDPFSPVYPQTRFLIHRQPITVKC